MKEETAVAVENDKTSDTRTSLAKRVYDSVLWVLLILALLFAYFQAPIPWREVHQGGYFRLEYFYLEEALKTNDAKTLKLIEQAMLDEKVTYRELDEIRNSLQATKEARSKTSTIENIQRKIGN